MILTPYPADFYAGDDLVNAVYCGDDLVWYRRVHLRPLQLAGAGALSAAVNSRYVRTGPLEGDGVLSAVTGQIYPSALGPSGRGTLSAVLTVLYFPAFSSDGTLRALVGPSYRVAPSGDGDLSASMVPVQALTTPFVGNGALSATATRRHPVNVNLSSTGLLLGFPGAVRTMFPALSGDGALSAVTSKTEGLRGDFSGVGNLVADARLYSTTTLADLGGSGALNAAMKISHPRLMPLLGDGQFAPGSYGRLFLAAGFPGAGALAAAPFGSYSQPSPSGGGAGTITVVTKQVYSITANFSGGGALGSTTFDATLPDGLSGRMIAVIPSYDSAAALSGNGVLSGTTTKKAVVPAALAGGGALSATAGTGVVWFTGDYSTGNFSQWSAVHNKLENNTGSHYDSNFGPSYPYPATIVTDGGIPAAKFEVRSGDTGIIGVGGSPRSEVADFNSHRMYEGNVTWEQFQVKFDPSWPTTASGSLWALTHQWHADTDGNPPVAFSCVVTNKWQLGVNQYSAPGVTSGSTKLWETPLDLDAWHTVKMQTCWSTSASIGFIRLWYDGVRQTFTDSSTTYFIATLMPGGGNNYYKEGLYRGDRTEAGIVYHRGYKLADSEAALSSTPSPPPTSPVAFGSAGAIHQSTTTSLTVPVPAGIALNDVILVGIQTEDDTNTVTSVPSGFTQKGSGQFNTGHFNLRIYEKRQTSATGAGETTGDYTFGIGTGNWAVGFALRYTGCVTTGDPIDAVSAPTPSTNSATTSDATSLTTSGADRLLVHIGVCEDNRSYTPPSGYTLDFSNSTLGGFGVSHKVLSALGPSGSVTNTWSATSRSLAWLGALSPP